MKKRFIWLLLAAVLILCCACGKKEAEEPPKSQSQLQTEAEADTNEPAVFPAGTTICGVDVSGLQAEEASAAILEQAEGYTLTLNLGRETLSYTAQDFQLRAGEADFAALLDACLAGGAVITVDNVLAYDLSPVEEALAELAEQTEPPINARLQFNEELLQFEIIPEGEGTKVDSEFVIAAIEEAILSLQQELTLSEEECFCPAEITADSETAIAALERANAMLALELTYTYTAGDVYLGSETIDGAMIAPWLLIQEDGLTVDVDPGPVNEYVAEMYEAYSLSNYNTEFTAHDGREMTFRVPSPGDTVDTNALYNDIVTCITECISGEREAPYVPEGDDFSSDFGGGTYVEIDLSAQHLWVYQNGEVAVETDIVTGCVNTGHATPGGVYRIQDKETERYLVGPDYKSWVNFWMPFNGGIGLHDADGWRWAYGPGIYLYSGSHGCINMPYEAAAATYDIVSVGTYVVLYGGSYSVPPLTQSVSGTSSYTVTVGDPGFTLDAKPAYEVKTVTYSSANPAVATVSETGAVSIVGPGQTVITVTAVEEQGYTQATFSVTVNVKTLCDVNGHTWDAGTQTTAPSCNVAGICTYTCTGCGETKTEAIATTAHTPDGGTVTKTPTCSENGTKTYCCTVCGEIVRTESLPIDSAVHTPDSGTQTTAPTCTAPGEKTFTCTGCSQVLSTEAVPATGHTPDAGTQTTAPTCTAPGIMSHVCTVCGTPLPDSEIPAAGHAFDGGTCTVCGTPE